MKLRYRWKPRIMVVPGLKRFEMREGVCSCSVWDTASSGPCTSNKVAALLRGKSRPSTGLHFKKPEKYVDDSYSRMRWRWRNCNLAHNIRYTSNNALKDRWSGKWIRSSTSIPWEKSAFEPLYLCWVPSSSIINALVFYKETSFRDHCHSHRRRFVEIVDSYSWPVKLITPRIKTSYSPSKITSRKNRLHKHMFYTRQWPVSPKHVVWWSRKKEQENLKKIAQGRRNQESTEHKNEVKIKVKLFP